MVSISGGDKLKAFLDKLRGVKPATLRVGILEGSTYADGTPIATVAAVHEFGTATTPARSFMRSTIVEKKTTWRDGFRKLVKANVSNPQQALEVLGEKMASDIRQTIRGMTSPALKPETIKRKGFGTLLVDSGQMRDSIKHEVVSGESK